MFYLTHAAGLIAHPKKEWLRIRDEKNTLPGLVVGYVLILALIGPVAGYYGTTMNGWQIGNGEVVKLTHESALTMSAIYYLATVISVLGLGLLVRWMCRTYGGNTPVNKCMALSAYVATPIFLIGVVEFYPILWLNLLFGLAAVAQSVYLLYSGVPVLMNISKDRGFLMSSALLALGMVVLVTLLASTAFLWGIGYGPSFTH